MGFFLSMFKMVEMTGWEILFQLPIFTTPFFPSLYLIYLSRLLVDQPTIRYYLWHECVQIHNIHLLVLPIKPHHCTQSIMCTSFFCFLYMSLQNPNITNIDWLLLSLLILLGHWLSNVHHTHNQQQHLKVLRQHSLGEREKTMNWEKWILLFGRGMYYVPPLFLFINNMLFDF